MLSSDVLRKHRRGLPLDVAAAEDYTPAARAEIYGELSQMARAELSDRRGVIVDATFGKPSLRAAFLDRLGDASSLCAVECHAPAALRELGARSYRG